MDIVEVEYLGRQAAVDAEEPVVDDGGEGQTVEGIHAGLVDELRVLHLALAFEGEELGEVAALVVTAEEEERRWVADFQGPEVEDTL